ncbi:hypothetical protein CVT24_007907, partial [Panaeolus cyanescens]
LDYSSLVKGTANHSHPTTSVADLVPPTYPPEKPMTHAHHPSRLSRLPTFISHWLGYRTHPLPPRPPHIVYLWSFIGSFVGLAVIQAVFGQAQYFIERGVPGIVASYGATAVLIYGAIEAPLAQPLPTFGGHFAGALIGVCITKLFGLIKDEEKFESLLWLSGSLACSITIVVMQMTGTTHPPAGATALLASTNTDIRLLGWYYLPVVMLTSVLALTVALINNNIQRRYPVFWLKPAPANPKPSMKTGLPPPTGIEELEKGIHGIENGLHHGHGNGNGNGHGGHANGHSRVEEKEKEKDIAEVREVNLDIDDQRTETVTEGSRSRACSRRDDSVV